MKLCYLGETKVEELTARIHFTGDSACQSGWWLIYKGTACRAPTIRRHTIEFFLMALRLAGEVPAFEHNCLERGAGAGCILDNLLEVRG